MIKRRIIVFILLFALAFLAVRPVAAEDTPPGGLGEGDLKLGGGANTVSITAPNDITDWVLRSGDNSRASVFQVSADGDWKLSATDSDTVTTKGHMTEWYGGNYITSPKQLENPMNVSAQTGGNVTAVYEVKLPAGGIIALGGTTNLDEKNVEVAFKQPVSSIDEVLTDGHRYKIVVTFTISSYP
ncbi:MAG: hypothetical protein PHQ34_04975 [Methanothrix sp.]|nr:hypothetical protein [Methanothrix sp.]